MKFSYGLSFLTLIWSLSMNAQIYGDVIEYWDFANGIPDDWENSSETGVSQWEYRGPGTVPDNTVCSQGSCGANSVPIPSITNDNGFVIFDSNYWDDSEGPCGNLGSGADPAPHNAWLITSDVDLSEYSNVALTFQQQFRHYTTTTSVWLSIDQGETWENILTNPEGFSSESEVVEWASVNISELAGGQSTVRLRFQFEGTYYWWLLDDIALYVPSDNDLIISNEAFTLFNGTLDPNGFGDMEYTQWPYTIVPPFNFKGVITNVGGFQQTEVSMNVRVTDDNNVFYFSENTASEDLAPGDSSIFNFSDPWSPSTELQSYTIRFKAEQAEEEETPLNNEVFKHYDVTPFTYARDEGEMVDTFVPSGNYADEPYMIGNLFESKYAGHRFHSIGVAFAEGSEPGTEVYGVIMDTGLDSIIAITETYTINEWDINEPGEEKVVHIQLQEDLITQADTMYAVMMVFENVDGSMYIARSGEPLPQTCLIAYPEINGLFYLLRTPVVRMHIFESTDIPGCTDPSANNYEPNADTEDGSCRYHGCTNPEASNFNPISNFEDGSCAFTGCTDPEAENFDPDANTDDGSCIYLGCTDPGANNFDESANTDDGSCIYNEAFMSASVLSGCAPLTVSFTNQTEVVDDGVCSFEIIGISTISECVDSFDFTFEEAGEYQVIYTYTVGEFESSYTLGPISVFTPPTAPIVSYDSDTNTLSCMGCENAANITWFNNDEVVVEAQDVESWSPLNNGNYSIEIVDENGCNATSESILVVVTHVPGFEPTSIRAYPNPTSGNFSVSAGDMIERIDVYTAAGRLVSRSAPFTNQVSLDLSQEATGVYHLTIVTGQEQHKIRLLIVK